MFEITKKDRCTGCTACYHVCGKKAILMMSDEEGFLYPSVNENLCIDCGMCKKVCPSNNEIAKNCNEQQIYGVKNKDNTIIKNSSSGGFFYELSNHFIDDGGIVYGAMYNSKMEVIHSAGSSLREAMKFGGSKYVQSNLGSVFNEIKNDLNIKKKVLFSGTPCQIAGLKNYLHNRVDITNLFTCDIICHGVPSPLIFRDYLNLIIRKYHKKIVNINMKDKTLGWTKTNSRIYFEDGKTIFNTKESNLWNGIFFSYNVLRPACYHCQYSNYERIGDITIGDFWGIENCNPEFYDKDGVSLILLNTSKGNLLFDFIKSKFYSFQTTRDCCFQNSLKTSAPFPNDRALYWQTYKKKGFKGVIVKYHGYGVLNIFKGYLHKLIKSK